MKLRAPVFCIECEKFLCWSDVNITAQCGNCRTHENKMINWRSKMTGLKKQ